jgi:hypothetical protein
MDSFTNIQQPTLTSVVSVRSSVTSGIGIYDVVPTRSMLGRRRTSVTRMSIAENAPATLSFHNINYIIGAKIESSKQDMKPDSTISFCKSQKSKQILFSVSGNFTNGMNAILGKIYILYFFVNLLILI